ncbi:MAG: energy transducer TonB [Armatimonadota bacterium]
MRINRGWHASRKGQYAVPVSIDFFRIWLPVSLVAHLMFFLVLQHLPAPVPSVDTATLIRIDITDATPPAPVKPAPEKVPLSKPALAHQPAQAVAPTGTPLAPPMARQPNKPLPIGPVTSATVLKPGMTGPARIASIPRVTADPSQGGASSMGSGAVRLPALAGIGRGAGEGADRPGIAGLPGPGGGGPGKAMPGSITGASGGSMPGAVSSVAILQPGMPGAGIGRGGEPVGGTRGGGTAPSGGVVGGARDVANLPAFTTGIMHGANGGWVDRPAGGGGCGIGTLGSAKPGPGRPGNFAGTGTTGPVGTAAGPVLGGGGFTIARGPVGIGPGGTPVIGGGPGNPLDRDIKHLPGGGSGLPGREGGWADRPGGSGGVPGGGPGGGGPGMNSMRPTFGAAAIGGPTPSYPSLAEKENQQGAVIVAVTVNTEGIAIKAAFVQRSNSDVLDNEARRTALKWKYSAAMENGKAINSTIKMKVTFERGKTPEVKQL